MVKDALRTAPATAPAAAAAAVAAILPVAPAPAAAAHLRVRHARQMSVKGGFLRRRGTALPTRAPQRTLAGYKYEPDAGDVVVPRALDARVGHAGRGRGPDAGGTRRGAHGRRRAVASHRPHGNGLTRAAVHDAPRLGRGRAELRRRRAARGRARRTRQRPRPRGRVPRVETGPRTAGRRPDRLSRALGTVEQDQLAVRLHADDARDDDAAVDCDAAGVGRFDVHPDGFVQPVRRERRAIDLARRQRRRARAGRGRGRRGLQPFHDDAGVRPHGVIHPPRNSHEYGRAVAIRRRRRLLALVARPLFDAVVRLGQPHNAVVVELGHYGNSGSASTLKSSVRCGLNRK